VHAKVAAVLVVVVAAHVLAAVDWRP
jgi:hypothetical protein